MLNVTILAIIVFYHQTIVLIVETMLISIELLKIINVFVTMDFMIYFKIKYVRHVA